MPQISPYSIVANGATLADDVTIGPFCYIGPKVTIGAGCVVENNVTIVGRTTLGADCHIFPLAVIGAPRDGDKKTGACTIGEANSIREHVTIYAGQPRKPTTLGKDNLVMIASQVGSGARVGDHCIFANGTHVASAAIIEDYVRTSAFSFVDESVRVGAYTFTAGYVHVDRDAPPFAMIQGSPFRVRGVNSHNLKQCGFGEEDIRALKSVFRELFNGAGLMNTDALDRLRNDPESNGYVQSLVRYLDGERDT